MTNKGGRPGKNGHTYSSLCCFSVVLWRVSSKQWQKGLPLLQILTTPKQNKTSLQTQFFLMASSFAWYLELCDFLFFHLKSSSRDFCSGKSSNLSLILLEFFPGTDPDSYAALWIVTLSYKLNHTHCWREGTLMLQHTETGDAVSPCTDPEVGAMRNRCLYPAVATWKLSLHSLFLLVNRKKKV